MEIKQVRNGYIMKKANGIEEIHTTLEEVFSTMLLDFEGRGKYFGGDSFGVVEIHREPTDKFPEVEPA